MTSLAPALSQTFTMGDEGGSKRAPWVTLKATSRAGQVPIWKMGEAEYECYDSRTSDPITLESGSAMNSAEATAPVDRLLADWRRDRRRSGRRSSSIGRGKTGVLTAAGSSSFAMHEVDGRDRFA
jgi:hypothetical protein